MRLSLLTLAGLAAAASPLGPNSSEYDRPDLTGSYWNVSISTQSGRPGYSIRDFSAAFHTPITAQTTEGKCHYSFVPQGTSPPAETDECSEGLKYEWDCKSAFHFAVNWKITFVRPSEEGTNMVTDTNVTFLQQTLFLGNDTLWVFGLSTKIETTRRSDGMSSTTQGDGRVDISHYCVVGWGCGYANGCISTECNDKKTGAQN